LSFISAIKKATRAVKILPYLRSRKTGRIRKLSWLFYGSSFSQRTDTIFELASTLTMIIVAAKTNH
jgi:hypothetical protein